MDLVAIVIDAPRYYDRFLGEKAIARLKEAYNNLPIYTNHSQAASDLQLIFTEGSTLDLLREALRKSSNPDDSVLITYGWYALLDHSLAQELWAEHDQYLSHYSFSENIPIGLIPDFASKEFVDLLPEAIPQNLRDYSLKNIEKYDVEVFFKLPDVRQFRLDFSAQNSRSIALQKSILTTHPKLKFSELEQAIFKNPQWIQFYPTYFEIEMTSNSVVTPIFSPSIDPGKNLDESVLEKLKRDIESNALEDDVTLSFAGVGEPTLHPRFLPWLNEFANLSQVNKIYLETYGHESLLKLFPEILKLQQANKVHTILRATTLQKQRYSQLYGTDKLAEVEKTITAIEDLLSSMEAKNIHVYSELIRMKEVEDEISAYFDRFEKSPIEVIVQKYNRYIELLPERRVSDLTPLQREFCWHLARDIFLNVNGEVTICKQDPKGDRAPTIAFKDHTILEILQMKSKFHEASVNGRWEEIPMPCLHCDEWYTFNG